MNLLKVCSFYTVKAGKCGASFSPSSLFRPRSLLFRFRHTGRPRTADKSVLPEAPEPLMHTKQTENWAQLKFATRTHGLFEMRKHLENTGTNSPRAWVLFPYALLGVPLTIRHFDVLLRSCRTQGETQEVLAEMTQRGIALDSRSFSALFYGSVTWTMSGALAKHFWDELSRLNVPAPRTLVQALLSMPSSLSSVRSDSFTLTPSAERTWTDPDVTFLWLLGIAVDLRLFVHSKCARHILRELTTEDAYKRALALLSQLGVSLTDPPLVHVLHNRELRQSSAETFQQKFEQIRTDFVPNNLLLVRRLMGLKADPAQALATVKSFQKRGLQLDYRSWGMIGCIMYRSPDPEHQKWLEENEGQLVQSLSVRFPSVPLTLK